MSNIKICSRCGDKLLEQAKKCPTCGCKDLILVGRDEIDKIKEIKDNITSPKGTFTPKWETNLEIKNKIWAGESAKKQGKKPKKQIISERKQIAKDSGKAYCPKCGSSSLSGNKKGFGVGKAVLGGYTGGPFGLMFGNVNAKKVIVTCLNCGHQWKA